MEFEFKLAITVLTSNTTCFDSKGRMHQLVGPSTVCPHLSPAYTRSIYKGFLAAGKCWHSEQLDGCDNRASRPAVTLSVLCGHNDSRTPPLALKTSRQPLRSRKLNTSDKSRCAHLMDFTLLPFSSFTYYRFSYLFPTLFHSNIATHHRLIGPQQGMGCRHAPSVLQGSWVPVRVDDGAKDGTLKKKKKHHRDFL